MKTLMLLRHAKSDWEDVSLPDFDRPLAARGRRAGRHRPYRQPGDRQGELR